MSVLVFRVVTPFGLEGRYRTYQLSEKRTISIVSLIDDGVSPKHWYLPTSPHGLATQKTNIDK
jgi:hypothetical protein